MFYSTRNGKQPDIDLSLRTIAATLILNNGKFTKGGWPMPTLMPQHPFQNVINVPSHYYMHTRTLNPESGAGWLNIEQKK